jgi:four helix bundle protein
MNFQDLDVYLMAKRLAINVYKTTSLFPKSEAFGMTSQMRRAAVSIPCNIAEGADRNSPKELIQFVGIARGSCAELFALIEISEGIGYIENSANLREDVTNVARMLSALLQSLRRKPL